MLFPGESKGFPSTLKHRRKIKENQSAKEYLMAFSWGLPLCTHLVTSIKSSAEEKTMGHGELCACGSREFFQWVIRTPPYPTLSSHLSHGLGRGNKNLCSRKHSMSRRRVPDGNASSVSQWQHLLYSKEKILWWKDF